MLWIFTVFAGLLGFAVMLRQLSVWFAILKMAFRVSLAVIEILGMALVLHQLKNVTIRLNYHSRLHQLMHQT